MPASTLPPLIAGRYRPVRLIGKGGMGSVYEVEHVHTDQRLALKVLIHQPGASAERFKREARAVSRIKSDHIVRVTDADVAEELDGLPFIVMELLEGANLERVSGSTPTAAPVVVEWLRQVARGLGKAHDLGIVHRDLKPDNLFLTRRDDGSPLVKILDFGIAKVGFDGTALTASDALLGTPGYMAPEQTDSRGPPITPRADLYTLGLIAFRLLTGRSYWVTGSLAQLLAQLLAEPMPPASERGAALGPSFDAWFAKACSRDVAKRFGSAYEQIEALAAALGLPADTTRPLEPAQPAATQVDDTKGGSLNGSFTDLGSRRRRTRRRVAGVGLVGGLALAAVAVAVLGPGAPRGASSSSAIGGPSSAIAAAPAAATLTPAVLPALAPLATTEPAPSVASAPTTTRAATSTSAAAATTSIRLPATTAVPATTGVAAAAGASQRQRPVETAHMASSASAGPSAAPAPATPAASSSSTPADSLWKLKTL